MNSIGVFKISNVSGKRRDVVPKTLVNGDDAMEDEDDEDEDTDSDDEESEDGGASTVPVIQVLFIQSSLKLRESSWFSFFKID